MSEVFEEERTDADAQTTGILINLAIGVPTVVISLFVFDYLRRRVPSIFEARRVLHHQKSELDYYGNRVYSPPPPSNRLFGWVRPVLHLELDTIADTHGLDTALFLRYLRSMTFLFFVLTVTVTLLLTPVYFTASNKSLPDENPLHTSGVQRFALSNVPLSDKWRFWLTLFVDIAICVLICTHIYSEFRTFSKVRLRYRSVTNPSNYAVLVQDIPTHSCNEDAIYRYWDRLFPGAVSKVFLVRNAAKLVKKTEKFWNAVTSRERAEWDYEYDQKLKGERPMHRIGPCRMFKCCSKQVDSIEYWAEKEKYYKHKVDICQNDDGPRYAPPTRAAFVVFHSRRVADVASQVNFATDESEWRVSRAPEPNAINWPALSIPGIQVTIRKFISVSISIALTLFWIIPVTFIMGLANLSAIAEIEINGNTPFAFAEDIKSWPTLIVGFIESILPAYILSAFLDFVPTILRFLISISRHSSIAKIDLLVRDWYFNFIVFSNFLFVVFSGTLLNRLADIIQTPTIAIDLLAGSIPQQGSFLMNFILIKALSETPYELMQLNRVLSRAISMKFFARTPREKKEIDTGDTEFSFNEVYAVNQLVVLLGLIYSTITPLIIPCCLAYFVINYYVWKYNLCYSMYNSYSDGGRMYSGALYAVWVGMFIHLLTMIGIFGLNKEPAQSILIIIPTVLSVVFVLLLQKSFNTIIKHGSSLQTQSLIEDEGGVDSIDNELADTYKHPGFEPIPDPVENLNGVGGNDGTVKYVEEVSDEGKNLALSIDIAELQQKEQASNSMSTDDWRDATSPDDSGTSPTSKSETDV